jgi:hypothetical protein
MASRKALHFVAQFMDCVSDPMTQPTRLEVRANMQLTDENIVTAGYMHTVETDEPLFTFDRKELIAMVRELLSASEPAGSPAQSAEAVAIPQVKPRLLNQLRRFNECCEDSEAGGHDVDREDMHSLAELGAVRPAPGGRHYMTDFGHYLLAAPQPSPTAVVQQGAWVNDPPRMPWEDLPNEDERVAPSEKGAAFEKWFSEHRDDDFGCSLSKRSAWIIWDGMWKARAASPQPAPSRVTDDQIKRLEATAALLAETEAAMAEREKRRDANRAQPVKHDPRMTPEAFLESMKPRANKVDCGVHLWTGWALIDAFNAGVRAPKPVEHTVPTITRDFLGQIVREAWVKWAKQQHNPKPSWLSPYAELSESDKEADRQIGEAVAQWALAIKGAKWEVAQPVEQTRALTVDARDAERYRYLHNPDPQPNREIDVCDDFMTVYDGDALDEAIDAALTAARLASGEKE